MSYVSEIPCPAGGYHVPATRTMKDKHGNPYDITLCRNCGLHASKWEKK
jgi:hypothetical protein